MINIEPQPKGLYESLHEYFLYKQALYTMESGTWQRREARGDACEGEVEGRGTRTLGSEATGGWKT